MSPYICISFSSPTYNNIFWNLLMNQAKFLYIVVLLFTFQFLITTKKSPNYIDFFCQEYIYCRIFHFFQFFKPCVRSRRDPTAFLRGSSSKKKIKSWKKNKTKFSVVHKLVKIFYLNFFCSLSNHKNPFHSSLGSIVKLISSDLSCVEIIWC